MIIRCPDKACAFHNVADGLPVHIIDEAIYAHLPTFIVATVDKFAQIPLSEKPAALFGISPERKPPELIIQDELHLISGPLGTVTGIYEAAITKLCERDGIGAKVIASTATIRNAKNRFWHCTEKISHNSLRRELHKKIRILQLSQHRSRDPQEDMLVLWG